MPKIPRVVVAGLRGGSGKTTLALSITAALARRGLKVVPFKKGPDYIDPGWLSAAAGSFCYNLDPYFMDEPFIINSFSRHAAGADIAVVEGNRGLFDGMDEEGTYSTSALARLLHAPVVLVVDATKTTRTAAAMVRGARDFEPGLELAGVVLNQISGERHRKVTTAAIELATGVPVLGAIPRTSAIEMPERHMGLVPSAEHPEVASAIDRIAEAAAKHLDLKRIVSIARSAPDAPDAPPEPEIPFSDDPPMIGVLRDSAFQFYYPDNIEALQRLGAAIIDVTALSQKKMPKVDALYIGGGFPETHAVALARNGAFRRSLLGEVEAGLPVYAECGGLMYLGRSITVAGKRHEMAGVFPIDFMMNPAPFAHGYATARVASANPFYRRGTTLKGHEFHYSEPVIDPRMPDSFGWALSVKRGKGIDKSRDGICYKNVFAAYLHVHSLGTPEWAEGMVRAALTYKRERA